MSTTEIILQSFTFAFDTTKVIQIYESTKLFRLIIVKKKMWLVSRQTTLQSMTNKSTNTFRQ